MVEKGGVGIKRYVIVKNGKVVQDSDFITLATKKYELVVEKSNMEEDNIELQDTTTGEVLEFV